MLVALSLTWRTILLTTGAPWQFCANKELEIWGKWLLSSIIVKRRFSIMCSCTSSTRSSSNDGWPSTALINHMLSTCCKLSAPATLNPLAHAVRPIDLAQLTMNFDGRYALCIQELYHRPHFTVGGRWNENLDLQPAQRCYSWAARQVT